MIREVSIRNFKCLRNVSVHLERFTVFVGPNASGKSSILQTLDILCRAFQPVIESVEVSPDEVETYLQNADVEKELRPAASRGSKGPVELAARVAGMWYRYRVPLAASHTPLSADQQGWAGNGQGMGPDLDSERWEEWSAAKGTPTPLPRSALLRLEPSNLVQSDTEDPDATEMTPEGSGLHAALASMALNDPDSWQQLQAELRRIVPTVRRLRHSKPPKASLLFDTVGADSLPADQVSEGTLLVLGLLAALHASGRPNLVLLDDLDRGLHPKAQRELISLLRDLLTTKPDLQIVATTHSPYLLNWVGPTEVRMTHLLDDGSTVCAPLTDHPKYSKWKDEFTPGELWSMFGERWTAEEGAAK